MSDHGHDHEQFSPNFIFGILFLFTALEVGWALLPLSKPLLWGGLIGCALVKGFLIFSYFMHFKFEKWIVRCLIAPTPVLMLIVVFAIMPDVARNKRMDHKITDMADPVTGQIVTIGSQDHAHGHGEEGGGH